MFEPEKKPKELQEISHDGEIKIDQQENGDEYHMIKDDNDESIKPLDYFSFLEGKDNWACRFFKWMREFELSHRDSCGLLYALFGAIIYGIVGILKCTYFRTISFYNFSGIMIFACLVTFYAHSRVLEVSPFLQNPLHQKNMIIGMVCMVVAGTQYAMSWAYWPRSYSHTVLALVPLLELIKEKISGRRVTIPEYLFFILNFIGMFILLCIPDQKVKFTTEGAITAGLSVLVLWFGFHKLRNSGRQSNVLSIGLMYCLAASCYIPIFFSLRPGRSPSELDWLIIFILGVVMFYGTVFFLRSFQTYKPSHSILVASLALALIILVEGFLTDGFVIWAVLGAILSAIGVILNLLNEIKKTEFIENPSKIGMA